MTKGKVNFHVYPRLKMAGHTHVLASIIFFFLACLSTSTATQFINTQEKKILNMTGQDNKWRSTSCLL